MQKKAKRNKVIIASINVTKNIVSQIKDSNTNKNTKNGKQTIEYKK